MRSCILDGVSGFSVTLQNNRVSRIAAYAELNPPVGGLKCTSTNVNATLMPGSSTSIDPTRVMNAVDFGGIDPVVRELINACLVSRFRRG